MIPLILIGVKECVYMLQVIKRDGNGIKFELAKINDAIMKAFRATRMEYTNEIVDLLYSNDRISWICRS